MAHKSKVTIPAERFSKVGDYLREKAVTLVEKEKLTDLDEVTLDKNVTVSAYDSWALRHESETWGFKVEFLGGVIIGTELASDPHSDCAARIAKMINVQDPLDHLKVVQENTLPIAATLDRPKPDVLVKVKGGHVLGPHHVTNNTFPVAVFEIGVSQSMPDLIEKLHVYIHVPTLQVYGSFKRYGSGGMLLVVHDRANNWNPPSHVISFGTSKLPSAGMRVLTENNWVDAHGNNHSWMELAQGVGFGGPACDIAQIPFYQFVLPAHTIFQGRNGGIPIGAPPNYVLDLFSIQEELSEEI